MLFQNVIALDKLSNGYYISILLHTFFFSQILRDFTSMSFPFVVRERKTEERGRDILWKLALTFNASWTFFFLYPSTLRRRNPTVGFMKALNTIYRIYQRLHNDFSRQIYSWVFFLTNICSFLFPHFNLTLSLK